VAKASLGAVNQFEVHWNPRAGSKPVMDLLSSVTNETSVRIEQGLLQSRTLLNYEILRGELRDVSILVPGTHESSTLFPRPDEFAPGMPSLSGKLIS
jgi:hypothetical protein